MSEKVKRVDDLLKLSQVIISKHKKEVFEATDESSLALCKDIIKHEAEELHIDELNDIETRYVYFTIVN